MLNWVNEDGTAASGKTFADAGCGVGSLAIPLADMGAKVSASDISSAMAGEAARRAKDLVRVSPLFPPSWSPTPLLYRSSMPMALLGTVELVYGILSIYLSLISSRASGPCRVTQKDRTHRTRGLSGLGLWFWFWDHTQRTRGLPG